MSELKNAEVETALSTLFERIDDLTSKVDSSSATAQAALSIAKEVKSSITNIHVAPTNGYDIAFKIVAKVTGVAIVGIIGWVIVKKAKILHEGYNSYLTKFPDGKSSLKTLRAPDGQCSETPEEEFTPEE